MDQRWSARCGAGAVVLRATPASRLRVRRRNGQALMPVETIDPFVIHPEPLPPEQDPQSPVAEAPALRRQGMESLPELRGIAPHRLVADLRIDARRSACRLGARSKPHRSWIAAGRPRVEPQALGIFSEQLPQSVIVEGRLCQELLQLAILSFELPQPSHLADAHPSETRLPIVEGRCGDPVPAAHLRRRRPPVRLLSRLPMICASVNLLPRILRLLICSGEFYVSMDQFSVGQVRG